MTLIAFAMAASETGVPVLLIMLAMVCDTILGVAGMTVYWLLHH